MKDNILHYGSIRGEISIYSYKCTKKNIRHCIEDESKRDYLRRTELQFKHGT